MSFGFSGQTGVRHSSSNPHRTLHESGLVQTFASFIDGGYTSADWDLAIEITLLGRVCAPSFSTWGAPVWIFQPSFARHVARKGSVG